MLTYILLHFTLSLAGCVWTPAWCILGSGCSYVAANFAFSRGFPLRIGNAITTIESSPALFYLVPIAITPAWFPSEGSLDAQHYGVENLPMSKVVSGYVAAGCD